MKNIIYEIMVNVQEKFTGPVLRSIGQRLYQVGTKIEGEYGSEDRMVPSLRNLALDNNKPQTQDADFIAPNATLIGNITAGEKSSIWYGATLIGNEGITIGNNTVVQDRVHISKNVSIGNNVFIGPNCILQGSTIHNRAFVAMGATVRQATIEKGGFVAAGAVVQDNTLIKEGEVWAGNPAKFLRTMTPLEREVIYEHLEEMQELACIHSEQAEKSQRELLNGSQYRNRLSAEQFAEHFVEAHNFPISEVDEEFVEQRIFMKQKLEFPEIAKDYEPYIYDMSSFSDKFNVGVHEEEAKRVATKIKQKEEFVNDRSPWNSPY